MPKSGVRVLPRNVGLRLRALRSSFFEQTSRGDDDDCGKLLITNANDVASCGVFSGHLTMLLAMLRLGASLCVIVMLIIIIIIIIIMMIMMIIMPMV
jgi:hypothetical protein